MKVVETDIITVIEDCWENWKKLIEENKNKSSGRIKWEKIKEKIGLDNLKGKSFVYIFSIDKKTIYIGESLNTRNQNRFLALVVQWYCKEKSIGLDTLIKHTPIKKCIEEKYVNVSDSSVITITIIKTLDKNFNKIIESSLIANCQSLKGCKCNRETQKKENSKKRKPK